MWAYNILYSIPIFYLYKYITYVDSISNNQITVEKSVLKNEYEI